MKNIKKPFLTGVAIGVCLGAIAGFLFPLNLFQYWKRLDYFPYPVTKIVNVWGNKIWVEGLSGKPFVLDYPCDKESCWQETKPQESLFDRSGLGPLYNLQVNETCRFENITYPLFRKIKMCAGTNYPVADTISWVYLALTENGEIWAWQGGSIVPPFCFLFPPAFAFLGIIPGSVLGLFLIGSEKPRIGYRTLINNLFTL